MRIQDAKRGLRIIFRCPSVLGDHHPVPAGHVRTLERDGPEFPPGFIMWDHVSPVTDEKVAPIEEKGKDDNRRVTFVCVPKTTTIPNDIVVLPDADVSIERVDDVLIVKVHGNCSEENLKKIKDFLARR